ncbi:response regulator transcription factor [Niabella terrae]
MAVRVLLYDDNEALRMSIEALIDEQPDLEFIAAMPNAETIDADIPAFKPDVVLMDIDMPVVNGVEAVRCINRINSSLPVIMLTVFDDNEHIFDAICAGADGYILKRYATTEIPAAIRDVMTGGAPMTGSIARRVLQMVRPEATSPAENFKLSTRESEILGFLVNGYSYKMIAAALGISMDTVRFHIKKIYDKLHVHSATEAVTKAIRNKLIN